MSIKRIAVLIAGIDYRPEAFKDPETGKTYEKSYNELMKRDTENMKLFLKMDIGGKWLDEEIICFPNDRNKDNENFISEVEKLLTSADHYLFFYYVGHGCKDKNENECMQFLIRINQ